MTGPNDAMSAATASTALPNTSVPWPTMAMAHTSIRMSKPSTTAPVIAIHRAVRPLSATLGGGQLLGAPVELAGPLLGAAELQGGGQAAQALEHKAVHGADAVPRTLAPPEPLTVLEETSGITTPTAR